MPRTMPWTPPSQAPWHASLALLARLLLLAFALPTRAEPPAPSASGAKSLASMQVMYYNRGELDARHAYKYEIIHQALEVTRPEYGDYQIIPYTMEPSAKRQSQLITEGKKINILWASPGTPTTSSSAIEIPVDILRGLLGYRICLTNGASDQWSQLNNIRDLQQLRIGQGLNWGDIGVYKLNGITPLQSNTFEGLFDMLSVNRFDCLPLGADEVLFTYRQNQAKYPQLQIEPHYLIHYEYPLYLYVSKRFPRLAERIKLGLHRLQITGAFEQLFETYFAADLKQLHLEQRQLLCLKSPYLESKQQSCSPKAVSDFIHKRKN